METAQRVSVEDWPRITRFYGISPSEISRLPQNVLRLYAEQLLELSAEEAFRDMNVMSMPYLDAADQRKVIAGYKRLLPAEPVQAIDVRTEDGRATAVGLGITIEVES